MAAAGAGAAYRGPMMDVRRDGIHRARQPAMRPIVRTEAWFEQPLRLNRILYDRTMRSLRPAMGWFAMSVTVAVLIVLGCKDLAGQEISTSRWLLGATTGVLSAWSVRIAVLICVARPRFIIIRAGELCLSDIGTIATDRVIHWSIERDITDDSKDLRCARLEIICNGLLWDKRWAMLLDDHSEITRLSDALEVCIPHAAS